MSIDSTQPPQRLSADERAQVLTSLQEARISPSEALAHLSLAHHGPGRHGFRSGFVAVGERVFPHPDEVIPLLNLLLVRLVRNAQEVRSRDEDLLNATLSLYGIVAIHPFEDANGRIAVDFCQFYLMTRWGLARPPLELPERAETAMGLVFRGLEAPCGGRSAEELLALRNDVAKRLGGATLGWLRQSRSFATVALCLHSALHEGASLEVGHHEG